MTQYSGDRSPWEKFLLVGSLLCIAGAVGLAVLAMRSHARALSGPPPSTQKGLP